MPRESQADLKKRMRKIIAALEAHPDAHCALDHSGPLELLVATILSAQCTDERVNIVTAELFKKYKTLEDYAAVPQEALQEEIRSTGFFRNKAKSIRESAQKIAADFGGKVPRTMDELLTLPGVARKTANVVLGTAFATNEGVVVDTHVKRLAGRLGISRQTIPDKIERDLMAIVPKRDWTLLAHLLIFHGRRICSARKPNCAGCPINHLCPSAFKA